MTDYNPQTIETAWQEKWEATELYRSRVDWDKPKHYALTMLPYPSGDLHIGHWYAMTPSDARARWMRMKGYNVLFPMGFDAFGLPAEQAAISRNIHPNKWTIANIERMRGQLRSMGTMFDWEREAVSCDPTYYKWTEWFFKKFYENDLAYRGEAMVNWSDALQTVLANEQVIDGKDERLGQPVIQKLMTQWFFRYRAYADEMLDFSKIDWPEPIKIMQTNWIGRSEGAKIRFKVEGHDEQIEVFTTRPDTLWGATFMVLAPEHPLVEVITTPERREAITTYQEQSAHATEIERMSETREKTGVFTGAYAVNPANDALMPIWIADYVMISYGTGAIMAVPYGDERDFAFARKFGLEIIAVVKPEGADEIPDPATMEEAYTGAGIMVNSGAIDGLVHNGEKGRKSPAISGAIDHLVSIGAGDEAINYRLRDWLISRQRYWGSPIPVVHRADGTFEVLPDEQLPVTLPDDVDFKPTGQSPLTYHEPFLNTVDSDGNPAKRETDTMDTFMCSSWYHLRYLSPNEDKAPFNAEEAAYWLPVDVYTGGAEHATMHLLYTRWFNKALRDLGIFDDALKIAKAHGRDADGLLDEPMMLLRNQGQVLGAERDGQEVVAFGQMDGDKLMAQHVEVIENGEFDRMRAPMDTAMIRGELMKRTERMLFIGEDMRMVEVLPDARVIIPSIEGDNDINQLKTHLEIQRMSKSKGNVVNPDELVAQYGADTVRSYLMFNFDWQKGGPWSDNNIKGVIGWLNDVWDIVTQGAPSGQGDPATNRDIERKTHQAIRSINQAFETFSFNRVIADQMKLKNSVKDALRAGKLGADAWRETVHIMLRLLAPSAPHMAEELWAQMGWQYSVHQQDWPPYDEAKAKEDTLELVIMVNGKPRHKLEVPADIAQADAEALTLADANVQQILGGATPNKIVFIPARGTQDPKINLVIGGK